MQKAPATYREIWKRKPVLRAIYDDIYRRILDHVVPGPVLEIGGGPGNFKLFAPATISSDILPAPWLDVICDAQRLPFADASIANIVMVDVLHHISSPRRFLAEAARVLRSGGRFIACEPAITPLSGIFYRFFHDERVDMDADPLAETTSSVDPYDSNQAIPTLLVGRFREACHRAVPSLTLEHIDHFSFLAYPLSGGFQPWSLLPQMVARPLLATEWASRTIIGKLAAFRMLMIYQRT